MEQKQDILNRQEYINQLIKLVNCLSEKHTSSCFTIDGQWGSGKTYVLDMFEKQAEKIQSEETANDKYFVFNYNCWKYDYYEEPSIAIVSTMLDKLEKEEKLMGKAKLIHEILCNNQKLNPALLCFEIMWVVFSYRRNTEKSVGSNKIFDDVINDKIYRILNNVLKDNTFWIFATLYDPSYGNKCDRYVNENSDNLQTEIKIAKEFEAIAKIMK